MYGRTLYAIHGSYYSRFAYDISALLQYMCACVYIKINHYKTFYYYYSFADAWEETFGTMLICIWQYRYNAFRIERKKKIPEYLFALILWFNPLLFVLSTETQHTREIYLFFFYYYYYPLFPVRKIHVNISDHST